MNNLREFIRVVLSQKITSAGIIVVKETKLGWRLLLLRKLDKYDLPKGHLKLGEEILAGAIRETREETSITDLDFKWGTEGFIANTCKFFLAATKQEPQLVPNPETKIYEHDDFEWVSFEKAVEKVDDWLKETILEAKNALELG